MFKTNINGYTIEVANFPRGKESRFVTLTNEQGKRYHFNMIKPNGKWIIRNPATVPSFIVEIEKEISKII